MPDNSEKEKQKTSAEEKLAGKCPRCEGDLVATQDAKNVQCKECGHEEPTYAEQ
jgi:uncharacterized protein (DUF983 family)